MGKGGVTTCCPDAPEPSHSLRSYPTGTCCQPLGGSPHWARGPVCEGLPCAHQESAPGSEQRLPRAFLLSHGEGDLPTGQSASPLGSRDWVPGRVFRSGPAGWRLSAGSTSGSFTPFPTVACQRRELWVQSEPTAPRLRACRRTTTAPKW